SMIFQDAMTAFDPVFTVGTQIIESIVRHDHCGRKTAAARALELMEMVAIPSARSRLSNFPHEMSGGMRQRAMIALALACRPKVLLADEPTTALDVTVQMQILLLLRRLQSEFKMAMVFVTHNVGVAVEMSDNIGVMYAGRIVEKAPTVSLMEDGRHPYTMGLLASTVRKRQHGGQLEAIPGAPPDLTKLPLGCAFSPRCRFSDVACVRSYPAGSAVGIAHTVNCIRVANKVR
ncbi:ABC transporter ATP-binding protein, partial [Mesorhizobium sp. M7A.F.Ca.US.006.01.1.1]|uniref:ABC transporter ATP-binding protein n=1 Tax=Mesorhizobium sp. M7A.F.Ca.US.006.01.1.1 TaxID=2496707 RepID=UPI000FD3B9D5